MAHRFLATRDEYEASPGQVLESHRAAWEGALGARGGGSRRCGWCCCC